MNPFGFHVQDSQTVCTEFFFNRGNNTLRHIFKNIPYEGDDTNKYRRTSGNERVAGNLTFCPGRYSVTE